MFFAVVYNSPISPSVLYVRISSLVIGDLRHVQIQGDVAGGVVGPLPPRAHPFLAERSFHGNSAQNLAYWS